MTEGGRSTYFFLRPEERDAHHVPRGPPHEQEVGGRRGGRVDGGPRQVGLEGSHSGPWPEGELEGCRLGGLDGLVGERREQASDGVAEGLLEEMGSIGERREER